ncbi:MAG: ribbon-helix-helix protein, CopG family [Maritimibacter sp.]|nr:ribbon-helix-helix protein, CopG family [Maritimibacter sp.]
MSDHIDWSTAHRANLEARRVNVDLPAWMVAGLDREAARLGVSRQALINLWIAERLE